MCIRDRVTVPPRFIKDSGVPASPIRFGERLFGRHPEPKQLVRLAGGGHDNLDEFGAMGTVRPFIDAARG